MVYDPQIYTMCERSGCVGAGMGCSKKRETNQYYIITVTPLLILLSVYPLLYHCIS